MEKFTAWEKCRITDNLEVLLVSFKRANITWKDKFKKYLGQSAHVADIFEDNTMMLKMENGKQYKFPLDCAKRESTDGFVEKGSEGDWKEEWKEDVAETQKCTLPGRVSDIGELSDSDRPQSFILEPSGEKSNWRQEGHGHCKRTVILDETFVHKIRDGLIRNTKPSKDIKRGNPDNQALDIPGSFRRHSNELGECTPPMQEFSELYQLLEAFNLLKYYQNLVNEGFESLEYLNHAEMDDLRASGLKRGHARRLLRALQEYRSNPNYTFKEISRNLKKRAESIGPRSSFTSCSGSRRGSSISRSSIPEDELFAPNDLENLPMIDNQLTYDNEPFISGYERSNSRKGSISNSSLSESWSPHVWENEGYLIIPFTKRPLGFGIMSPFNIGAMVSSIADCGLKMKGLDLGLPLLHINNREVVRYNLEQVASVLARVELPCTVTFGLQPYFQRGQRVMVMRDNKWHRCTVVRMSKRSRKVIVKYGDQDSRWKISDYNSIKRPGQNGPESSQVSTPKQNYQDNNIQAAPSSQNSSSLIQILHQSQNSGKKNVASPSIGKNGDEVKEQPNLIAVVPSDQQFSRVRVSDIKQPSGSKRDIPQEPQNYINCDKMEKKSLTLDTNQVENSNATSVILGMMI